MAAAQMSAGHAGILGASTTLHVKLTCRMQPHLGISLDEMAEGTHARTHLSHLWHMIHREQQALTSAGMPSRRHIHSNVAAPSSPPKMLWLLWEAIHIQQFVAATAGWSM